MALASQAGNDYTAVQGSTAHSNNCGGQVAIMLTPVQVANNFCKLT
jgi:hypothetical protein